jgi:putative FmdB family regulatory protein
MPTYSYHCDTCGHDFDAVQKFADDPLRECPECSAPIRRVIQPVGVVFKGSGWYITDSRPKSSSDTGESKAKTDSADKAADRDGGKDKTSDAVSSAKTEMAKKSEKSTADVA